MEHTDIDAISQFIGCIKSDITIRCMIVLIKNMNFQKCLNKVKVKLPYGIIQKLL